MICFKGCQKKIDELTTSLNYALNQHNFYITEQLDRLKKVKDQEIAELQKQLSQAKERK